ncbi:HD domain-containing protein [Chaetomium strumarium]|uniref:5'-deoxynucleotidase n=1 Tax=Chaetomium strumarium TaxID=1170767 RepID=A0AAJ0M248_9PEZI|nr:HD domain-containing protein [Chaetomium strumarium]
MPYTHLLEHPHILGYHQRLTPPDCGITLERRTSIYPDPLKGNSRPPSIVTTEKVEDPWTVEKALATIDRPAEGSTSPVPFFHLLERLKTTKRAGWMRFRIQRGGSVADHSWRMAMMAALPATSLACQLDIGKCIKMYLFHDMAESLVGDLTPADDVPKTEKHRREADTISYIEGKILHKVNAGGAGQELVDLWREFEEGKSLESRFIQDFDKIEMLLQMVEYERRAKGRLDLSEFTYVETKVLLPETQAWAKKIIGERKEFWKTHGSTEAGASEIRMRKMQDAYYSN